MIEVQTEAATVSITELMALVGRIAYDLERSIGAEGDRVPCDSLIHIDVAFDG